MKFCKSPGTTFTHAQVSVKSLFTVYLFPSAVKVAQIQKFIHFVLTSVQTMLHHKCCILENIPDIWFYPSSCDGLRILKL